MKKIILSVLVGTLAVSSTIAQDSTSTPLVLGGSVDTYYRTTLNTSDQGANTAPATSFANGVGFNVGMINLIASKEGEKAGFVADLVFGQRGADAVFNNQIGVGGVTINDALSIVNQAYAYYNINDDLTFTLGNFNTFLGYEVISPSVNFNYSTSYMFSYGPFSHTGAKLDYSATDELSFMVAALNPTDFKSLNGLGNNLFLGAQVGYEVDKGGVWVNYLGGNAGDDGADHSSYHQVDITTGFNWTEDLYLGLNATFATQGNGIDPSTVGDSIATNSGFWGIAGYAQYAVTENVSFGGRVEYLTDNNEFIGLPSKHLTNTLKIFGGETQGSVIDLTLSANVKFGDLTFIPEVRADFFNEASRNVRIPFQEGSLLPAEPDGGRINAIGSVALAAVYTF